MRITKNQTNFLKGIGILLIMFHNFFHLTKPYIGENEFDWDIIRIQRYLEVLMAFPEKFLTASLSYMGHYGVQIFIVLSAYGLSIKYFNNQKKIRLLPFMIDRLKKIYPVYFLAILFLVITVFFVENRVFNFYEWRDLVLKLMFINNFIPNKALNINGPWWFFSLIIQLYVLFPLLFYFFKRNRFNYISGILFLVSYYIIFALVQPILETYNLSLLYLFPGHLPEFVMGMVFVFYPRCHRVNYKFLGISIFVFILANFYSFLFPITFISISYILFHFLIWLESKSPAKIKAAMVRLGELSFYLFAIHGFLRKPWITYSYDTSLFEKYIFAVVFFFISLMASLLLEKILMYFNRLYRFKRIA
ncbi:acyltransferase [uncultured Aquimarina sp.]|uniref:acyltransferase family protein n=1 Tax=uncultured Aquimarina sp. TaxID=575652 RepID=UPI00262762AC|nr:acyltransferase [uncultured Aquimarina sp.]